MYKTIFITSLVDYKIMLFLVLFCIYIRGMYVCQPRKAQMPFKRYCMYVIQFHKPNAQGTF